MPPIPAVCIRITAATLSPRRCARGASPMARPLRCFMQEHFYEKPRNVLMQINGEICKNADLALFISRHDYNDNHDVFR